MSGYIDDPKTKKHIFFYYFDARESPQTAPLTLWLNGGPGKSSTITRRPFLKIHCSPFFSAAKVALALWDSSWNSVPAPSSARRTSQRVLTIIPGRESLICFLSIRPSMLDSPTLPPEWERPNRLRWTFMRSFPSSLSPLMSLRRDRFRSLGNLMLGTSSLLSSHQPSLLPLLYLVVVSPAVSLISLPYGQDCETETDLIVCSQSLHPCLRQRDSSPKSAPRQVEQQTNAYQSQISLDRKWTQRRRHDDYLILRSSVLFEEWYWETGVGYQGLYRDAAVCEAMRSLA